MVFVVKYEASNLPLIKKIFDNIVKKRGFENEV